MKEPAVYLAGPLGFTEAGRRYHDEAMLPAVVAAGLHPLDPWDVPSDLAEAFLSPPGPDRLERLTWANERAAARNAELIRRAAVVVAVLDGADVDSGTAAEIGYAAAIGVPVVGLRTDVRTTGDNEAALVNLQVQWFIESTGGRIHSNLEAAVEQAAALARRASAAAGG